MAWELRPHVARRAGSIANVYGYRSCGDQRARSVVFADKQNVGEENRRHPVLVQSIQRSHAIRIVAGPDYFQFERDPKRRALANDAERLVLCSVSFAVFPGVEPFGGHAGSVQPA